MQWPAGRTLGPSIRAATDVAQEEVTMKHLAITCSIGVMLVAVAAPTASAEQAPPPPSAMERLIRQEDARWNDPRLGLAEKPSPQPSAVQRLVRQEDARANDPRLGVATGAPPSPKAPTIQIIAVNSFDWLSAGIGGIASAAALLVALGLWMVARSHHPRRV